MQTSPREFFVAGGTLQPDAPSYIERQADRELFERVLAGDFCYVLTPRQMGKSSLMARTAKRLREQGVETAIVDLTQIGTEKEKQSADRWYYGISHRILRELGLNIKLNEWWQERQNLPALQRFTEFFSDLVLANNTERVVIFVDEIDSTISVPFADDFFAAIRACYNARATEPQYRRLSFVLLGVASPSDLMKDARRTPFNIGQRLDLTDFTFAEAQPLAAGLNADRAQAERALQRILYWTNGHPYLTQKLCQAVAAEKLDGADDAEIDRMVDKNFLAPEANRTENNLSFVRDRLIKDRQRSRLLLKLYRRIGLGQTVIDNPLSPAHAALKLSGLVTAREDRRLSVRNLIYQRVFTPEWAKRVMPPDWNRRVAMASSLMLLLAIAAWYLVLQPQLYIREIERASDDVPNVPYQNLRRLPFYQGKADELMAKYWDRRALRVEQQEQRDEGLLYCLRAATFHATATREQEAGRLAAKDYPHLLATYRHSDRITAVAFSPDGQKVVTGSEHGTAQLWSAQNGTPLGEPMRHQSFVTAVAFSPDGQKVATGSRDGTVRLWSAANGSTLGPQMQHQGLVYAVVFSPDGQKLLTGSDDGTAQLWFVANGSALGPPMRHQSGVVVVAFSPDGQKVITGSWDHTARLWSVANGSALGSSMRNQSAVFTVAFSPDGQKLLTGSDDGTAQLWSIANGSALGSPMRHQSGVEVVAFSPDGQKVLTGSWDHTARLWSAENGSALGSSMWHQSAVMTVAFSPDGLKVLTGSCDGTVQLWSAQNGAPLGQPIRHVQQNQINNKDTLSTAIRNFPEVFIDLCAIVVVFSPNGQQVLIGSEDGTTRLWSMQEESVLGSPMRHERKIVTVAFSPDGQKVLTGSADSTAQLWSSQNGTVVGEPMRHEGEVVAVAFSPDGQKVLTGSWDGTARLWSAQNGASLSEPMRHAGKINAVAFSPDGQKMVTGSWDNTARLWSAQNGAPLGEPMRHEKKVVAVAFSPDGQKVVTGSMGNTARLWSAQNGAPLGEPMLHEADVVAVAFSPDGQQVLTGCWDHTAWLWSTQTGAAMGPPIRYQYQNEVVAVAFSPDGKIILAATNGWVHLSSVASDTSTPVSKASRLLAGSWTGAYRFLDPAWSQMQVAVHVADNAIKIDTLRFDIPNAPALKGDPKTLLAEWQQKLALKFDANGKIVPRYPVEAGRER